MSQRYFTRYDIYNIDIDEYDEHPIWTLKSITKRTVFDHGRLDLVNFVNSLTKKNTTYLTASDMIIDLTLKRSPLYIMINGFLPCFILNLVILIAFPMPFASQVFICNNYNVFFLIIIWCITVFKF